MSEVSRRRAMTRRRRLLLIVELLIPRPVKRCQRLFDGDGPPATGGLLGNLQPLQLLQCITDLEIGSYAAATSQPMLRRRINLFGRRIAHATPPQEPPGKNRLTKILLLGF